MPFNIFYKGFGFEYTFSPAAEEKLVFSAFLLQTQSPGYEVWFIKVFTLQAAVND